MKEVPQCAWIWGGGEGRHKLGSRTYRHLFHAHVTHLSEWRHAKRAYSLVLCVVVVVASVFFLWETRRFFCLFVFVAALRLLVVSWIVCWSTNRCVGRSVGSLLPSNPPRGQQFFPLSSLFLTSYRVVNLHLYVLFFVLFYVCVYLSMDKLQM